MDVVGGAYCENRSPVPSDRGVCSVQALEDYDNVHSGHDRSDDNVRNGNDDECNGNVQNRNDEEASDNATIGGDVQGAMQG